MVSEVVWIINIFFECYRIVRFNLFGRVNVIVMSGVCLYWVGVFFGEIIVWWLCVIWYVVIIGIFFWVVYVVEFFYIDIVVMVVVFWKVKFVLFGIVYFVLFWEVNNRYMVV